MGVFWVWFGIRCRDEGAKLWWVRDEIDMIDQRAVSMPARHHVRGQPQMSEFVSNVADEVVTIPGIGGCAGQRSQCNTGRRYCEHGE